MIAAVSIWALKFLVLSTAFAGGYAAFARLRPAAAERFLLAKVLLFASPWLALLTLPSRDVIDSGFIEGDALGRVVTAGSVVVARPESSLDAFGLALYGVVAALLLLRLLLSLIRMAAVARSGRQIESWRGIPVIEHDQNMPPATFGIWRSRIFIPRLLATSLSRRELEVIFAHETVHVGRSDFRWKLGARLLACFTYFSPGWFYLLRRFEEEMELSCDDQVRTASTVSSKEYAGLLVRLAASTGDARQVPVCSMSSTFRPSLLRRVSAMKRDVIQSKKSIVFAGVFALALAGLPVLLVSGPESQAEPKAEAVKLMDPSEGFILSVKAHVKDDNGKTFKMEISRVVRPGKRTFLAGNNDVTVEFQYALVDSNLETVWFLANGEGQPLATSKVTVEPQHGATVEGRSSDGKREYTIEFWDVTKKRTLTDAKNDAELKKRTK